MKKIIFIAFFPFLPTVYANSLCESFVETSVSAISFAEAYKKVSVFSPKGEFETTEEYKSRTEDIKIPSQLIISRKADIESFDGKDFIFYNADEGLLKISEFAFHNMNIGAHLISKYNTPELDFDYNSIFYHSVPFGEMLKSTEYYPANNSYGAKTKVQRDLMDAELLIDPRKAGLSVPIFKSLYPYSLTLKENNNVIGELKLTPKEAKSVKETSYLAFVVEPVKPYNFQKEYTFPEAKISSPYEKNYTTSILVANLKCGLWLDRNNKVIGSYPINFEKSR